jgi:hypothetical protein
MKPLIKFKAITLLLISLVLSCFVLLPSAQAQAVRPDVSSAPDGFYKGFNTAEGFNALLSLSTGQLNTAVGFATLKADTTGSFNTAVGAQALLHNKGNSNVAVGVNALVKNTTGEANTAVGQGALASNTIGSDNTAHGFAALAGNIDGTGNTAMGILSLTSNTSGVFNTANGYAALEYNTTGSANTASGLAALGVNATGDNNTASGADALFSNTTGGNNTATGVQALISSETGNNNTAYGVQALYSNNGSGNIGLGYRAGYNLTTGSNNIDIANPGVASEANTIRIGFGQTRTFIAGIRGRATGVANAVPVLIDSNGQLGTASSSRRFKEGIKPIDQTSEAILALKPVTFHYKSDSTGTPQFGLIAEDVAAVNPDLVVRDENGEIYTVRYDAVNAMLLNEFLKEHKTVQKLKSTTAKQEATIAQQRKDFQAIITKQEQEIQALTASVKEQAAQIQRVNARLEMSRPSPQLAESNQ